MIKWIFFLVFKKENLRSGYSGIRPKITSKLGSTADFVIKEESSVQMNGLIQLFGIESPGLTSCIPIGNHVCDLLENSLRL